MSIGLPSFPSFDVSGDPSSLGQRWESWIERFENYLVAFNIEDTKRQRALLLHFVGEDVYNIFRTLKDTGAVDNYDKAKAELTKYFQPKKNVEYEIFTFRQAKQNSAETLDMYATRLRQLARYCEFPDIDREIKSQIIQCSSSNRLRRNALKDAGTTLQGLLDMGRAIETSEKEATAIETSSTQRSDTTTESANVVQYNPRQGKQTTNNGRKCRHCGYDFPHRGGMDQCPAKGKTCNACGKLNHFAQVCRSTNHSQAGSSQRSRVSKSRPRDRRTQNNVSDAETSEDSSNESDINSAYVIYRIEKKRKPTTVIKIQDTSTRVLIDSGASVNIMDEATFHRLKKQPKLQKTKTKLYGYGKIPIPVMGKITAQIESTSKITCAPFYVVTGDSGTLLSYDTATELSMIRINAIKSDKSHGADTIAQMQNEKLFKGIGKLKNFQAKLHIDASVRPHRATSPPHTIPLAKKGGKGIERTAKTRYY